MAISFVQTRNNQTVSTSTTVTPSTHTTGGNLLVAAVYEDASNSATLSIADSAGQTWLQVGSTVTVGTGAMAFFYKPNSAQVTTITGSSTVSATLAVCFAEYSGAATGSPLDGFATATASAAGTTLTSGALTTTNATDVLIYFVGQGTSQTTYTAGSGFSVLALNVSARCDGQYQVVSATQSNVTTSMTFSSGGDRIGIFAAFSTTNIGGSVTFEDDAPPQFQPPPVEPTIVVWG